MEVVQNQEQVLKPVLDVVEKVRLFLRNSLSLGQLEMYRLAQNVMALVK